MPASCNKLAASPMAMGLLMPVWTRTPGSPSSTIATLLPAWRHRGCARAQYCSTTPPPRGESAYTVGMRRLVSMAALFLLALPAMAARQVAVVTEGELAPPARHGLGKLREALRAKGFELADSAAHADYVILLRTRAPQTLQQWKAPVPAGREALTIWRGRYLDKPAIALFGGDASGLMYAALDTAGRIGWSSTEPFEYVRDTTEKPYLAERGVSMYTMQRAYFESRLHDQAYWKRYFDMLAADRINSFVVIFGYENGGFMRSEERRVGKECRSRWSPYHLQK